MDAQITQLFEFQFAPNMGNHREILATHTHQPQLHIKPNEQQLHIILGRTYSL